MAVAVKGGLDRGMAELGLDEFGVGVLGDQQDRVGVAQIVEADFAKPSANQGRMKFAVNHVVRVNRISGRVAACLSKWRSKTRSVRLVGIV